MSGKAPRSDVLVLGGGFAGLACATALAERGARVTLLEKKPHLGGRAYSFVDPATRDVIDNGQHLFMGCYRHTRRFLARIGTADRLSFAEKIRIDFADSDGRRGALHCPKFLRAPWHLAWGVWRLGGLSLRDKVGLWRLDRALRRVRRLGIPESLDRLTVREWLDSLGQPRRLQERLLNPIALGALNEDPKIAAATGLAQVLQEIFFRDAEGARLGLATVGLSDLYTGASRSYVEERGGRILLSRRVAGVIESKGRTLGVRTERGESFEAGAVVSTLPPWDLKRITLPQGLDGPWANLAPAPIISLTITLDRPILHREPLVGMLGTEIQWAFNKSLIQNGGIAGGPAGGPAAPPDSLTGPRTARLPAGGKGQTLALVISGARGQLGWSPKALLSAAERDLGRCFPEFKKARIRNSRVVKEPFATISPAPGAEAKRLPAGRVLPGLYLAGDWTRTGLPATIESAVLSAHQAAAAISLKG